MAGGRCFGLEWLEPRHLLTASSSPIAAVQPFDGQQLSQSPQQLVITFNGLNVAALMGTFDIQLEELNRDGTTTPVWTTDDPPPEDTDASPTDLIIPLQKYDPSDYGYDNLTLPAGEYAIELLGGTALSFGASGAFGPGPQLWDPTQSHAIGEFTVLGGGPTLATATPLGQIGSTAQSVWGSLDPDQPDSAVDLYQFTLPAGHFWQVGLAISAQNIGSPLLTSLSLMDSSGTVLATRDSGTGLTSNPDDPYLFTGLKPGTYYVGVSGAGNLANEPGGYDPVLGIPGSGGLTQPGGRYPFELSLVASAHDQPTQLVNFTLDRADLHESSPTGISLTFSAPIDLSNLFEPDAQESALEVVDSSGQVWPISANDYQVSGATLNLIFVRPLPAGSYTLMVVPGQGLNDLAGQPVFTAGKPAGVLASWTVASQTTQLAANDLGVLWPFTANALSTGPGAFKETTILAPGQEMDYRWVVTVPGFYKLQTELQGGPVSVQNAGNGATTVLEPGSDHQLNDYLMNLNAGVYTLRFANLGSSPVRVDWLLKIANLDWEKIVDNGVGQNFALNLSMFSTTPGGPGASSLAGLSALAGSGSGGVFAGSSGPIPATLLVTLNTGLIGQPTLDGQTVAAVGPTVATGSTALAVSGTGLGEGLQFGRSSGASRWPGDDDQLADNEPAAPKPVPHDPAVVAASLGALARLDPLGNAARADERALGQAEWLVRLGTRLQSWLAPAKVAESVEQLAAGQAGARGLVAAEIAGNDDDPNGFHRTQRSTSSAQFDLGATACMITIGAVTCRLQRPLLKWWRRTGKLAPHGEKLARPLHRGPHTVASARARATTRLRKSHTAK